MYCSHQDFSCLGFCGGTFGCGHPEPTQVLLWLVAGLDAGCRHCWQRGHLLDWGGDPDLVVVLLSRSQGIVLCNAYIIPIKTMMRNSMGTFLQGLTSGLWWSAFGPLLASPVFPGSKLVVQLRALFLEVSLSF